SASKAFERHLGILPLEAESWKDVVPAAREWQPDLVLVLDEQLQSSEAVRQLKAEGFSVFCPSDKAAGLIAGRDQWMGLCQKHGLPVPAFQKLTGRDEILQAVSEKPGPWVFDLLDGTGRYHICYEEEEVQDLLDEWFGQKEGADVLMTDYSDGICFELSCMVHDSAVFPIGSAVVQRGFYEQENDEEMKGLAAFTPDDVLSRQVLRQAVEDMMVPFAKAMSEEGISFTGFLTGQFVWTGSVLRCVNLKAGLSECGGILSFMNLPVDPARAAVRLMEGQKMEQDLLQTMPACTALTALYADSAQEPSAVELDEDFEGVFYPHTMQIQDGRMSAGPGRTAFIAARGNTRSSAGRKVLEACSHIHGNGLSWRRDVGRLISEH
ncbi:MAG: hypothetical protein HUJ54_07885, partial [Erysipelotrichaceae bacterium]|nr:hypothetical protein [Erysipelotrichaceae bacterium]